MKNKVFLLGMFSAMLVFALMLTGCGGDDGEPKPGFSSETKSISGSDLGFTTAPATLATSGNRAVATASVTEGTVTITSVGAGSATITVYDDVFHDATVQITVGANGKITKTGEILYNSSESDTFASATIDIDNTEAELGLIGASYGVSPAGQVTVAIIDGKVKITSLEGKAGPAIITIKSGAPVHEATIAVIVSAKGKVILGAISKYDLSPNGKTYYPNSGSRIEFSTVSAGTSGIYSRYENDSGNGSESTQKPKTEEGSYSWNSGTKKVTLTPTKLAYWDREDNISLLTKDEYIAAATEGLPGRNANPTLAEINALGWEEYESLEDFYAEASEWIGKPVNSWAQVYDGYIKPQIEWSKAEFAPRTYGYSFSIDEKALFLDEPLPANKGKDELSSGTGIYHVWVRSWSDGQSSGSIDETNTFTFKTDGTFTYVNDSGYENYYNSPTEGTYAYDSLGQWGYTSVYLKATKIGGKTRAEYYEQQNGTDEQKAAETNDAFKVREVSYDTTDYTIGWKN